jgi:hypothetical protein
MSLIVCSLNNQSLSFVLMVEEDSKEVAVVCYINHAVEEGSIWELIGPTNKMIEWLIVNDDEQSSISNSDPDGL